MWTCPKCTQRVDDQFEICWKCGTTVDGVEDPGFFDERTGVRQRPSGPEAEVAPDSLVTLIKCSKPAEAHAIRVRMESEGIPVFLFDEFTITMDWLLSNAIGGIKVQVPLPYLERAQAILGIVAEQEQLSEEEDGEAQDDEEWADGESTEVMDPSDERIQDLEGGSPAPADEQTAERQQGIEPDQP